MTDGNITIEPIKKGPDLATIIGLLGGLGLIVVGILIGGGSLMQFFDPPSVLIVVIGTVFVTTISFGGKDMAKAPKVIMKALFQASRDPSGVTKQMLQMAEFVRKGGPVSMEKLVPQLEGDEFLVKAAGLISDGMSAEEIENLMQEEIEALAARHGNSISILKRGSEVSPVMGLIGTLIGLVLMLANLSDPSSIGPAMAVALLTTFYGAVLGNVVLSPMAGKLERNSANEILVMQINQVAAGSISRQENPRRLEMLLNTLLPPTQRVKYFD